MKRYALSLLVLIAGMGSMWSIVATPEPIDVRLSDGSTVTLRLVGDEFCHYYTTLDGKQRYELLDGVWEQVPETTVTERMKVAKARRVQAETLNKQASYPLTGSPKSLVILVNFADLKFQYPLERFQRMLTESGYSDDGSIGSARDYFIASSDSIFSPQFDCYGPVTVSKGYAYYGTNNDSRVDVKVGDMIVEACQLVSQSGVDLAQYDTDNDGRIDNVFIYYAGHNEAEHGPANTIWPHRSAVNSEVRINGKRIYDYACTSELRGASGNSMCGISVFCHEFSHVLGIPDYYDPNYIYYTLGAWDLMCSGGYNGNGKTPPAYTAAERWQLGWLKPVQLDEAGPYTLEPLETSYKAYLIAKTPHNLLWSNASPNEYWLLENRQHVGWDTSPTTLPATGMLIFHITYSATAWGSYTPNTSLPLRYDLVEANGSKGFAAASDPFPGSANVTQFTPTLHSGEIVEQPLLDIAESGDDITFTFKSNGDDKFMILPTALPLIESTYNTDDNTAVTPASKLKIIGSHLDPELPVTVSSSKKGFQLSLDSTDWSMELNARVEADSTMELVLFVRYAPRKLDCDIQHSTLTFRQGKSVGTYKVTGTSPRPTLIVPPEITKLEDVTPTSFKVRWVPQADAEEYYVTLYHMEEGSESTMESFEGFDDEATVHERGWGSNFFRTTAKAKEDGEVSMWFKQDGEQMTTPVYTLPVTKLSLWVNALPATDREVGWIILKGIGEDVGEVVIDTIQISKGTKKETYSKTFSESEGMRRFILSYAAFGGEGVCVDAFTTTFNQRTVYTYKNRDKRIQAQEGEIAEKYALFYASDLLPNTTYCVRLQAEENKGCQEHLTELSTPLYVQTKAGGGVDSKYLTLDVDSVTYDPARHVVYLPTSETSGWVYVYTTSGELVTRIEVGPTQHVVPLPDEKLHHGVVYIVKYMPSGKVGRKSPWVKIML